MKTIKAKVIMLPTNDKPAKGSILLRHLWKDTKLECRSVWQYNETKQLSHTAVYTTLNGSFMDAPSSFKSQHIYLTTDEEIKEGDYYIIPLHKGGHDARKYSEKAHFKQEPCISLNNLKARKLVATTDTSLGFGDEFGGWYPLPQIPQEFLKEYCEADGKIDEVGIEITCLYGDNCPSKGAYDKQHLCNIGIKVDSNNCVIIHKSKESWSREEVENLLYKHTEMMLSGYRDTLDNWIKENL